MAAHCLLGVSLAWVGGGGPVVGRPVTEPAFCRADIVLELPALTGLFGAPQSVDTVAGGAHDRRCYWPRFTSDSRLVAGDVVGAGGTGYTEGPTA